MPFFDDQHYNAAALVDAGCAQRIAKHPVNAEEVRIHGGKGGDVSLGLIGDVADLDIAFKGCLYVNHRSAC